MADQVLYSGVACITDLMVKEGLINLDFADVRSIMSEMGKAMMGTGEATGEKRAVLAAEAAIANPLLDETSMKGARGLLISITGGNDLTLYEVDEAASRIRQEVDEEANIILGATFDPALDGVVRVSVVATGIDQATISQIEPSSYAPRAEAAPRMRAPAPAAVRAVRAAPTPVEALQPTPVVNDVEIQPVAPAAIDFPEPIAPRREYEEKRRPLHSAGAGAADRARSAHAADRGSAAGGPEVRFAQMRERESQPAPAETRRRSLLEKLAAFGITRHDDEPAPKATNPVQPPVAAPRPLAAPVTHADFGRAQPRPQPQPPRASRARSIRTAGRLIVLR